MPVHFEQAAELVTPEQLAEKIPCGPDPDRHAETIKKYVDAGFDEIHIGQVGDDQQGFFDFFTNELLVPPVSGRTHLALVGLMGSGKTSVGRVVADRLGLPLVDVDDAIRARTGREREGAVGAGRRGRLPTARARRGRGLARARPTRRPRRTWRRGPRSRRRARPATAARRRRVPARRSRGPGRARPRRPAAASAPRHEPAPGPHRPARGPRRRLHGHRPARHPDRRARTRGGRRADPRRAGCSSQLRPAKYLA